MAKKRSAAQRAADRKRPGRPPKPIEKKRSVPVMVYLTENERIRLASQAEREGVTLASLIMRPWRGGE
jgi:hypothetical protein